MKLIRFEDIPKIMERTNSKAEFWHNWSNKTKFYSLNEDFHFFSRFLRIYFCFSQIFQKISQYKKSSIPARRPWADSIIISEDQEGEGACARKWMIQNCIQITVDDPKSNDFIISLISKLLITKQNFIICSKSWMRSPTAIRSSSSETVAIWRVPLSPSWSAALWAYRWWSPRPPFRTRWCLSLCHKIQIQTNQVEIMRRANNNNTRISMNYIAGNSQHHHTRQKYVFCCWIQLKKFKKNRFYN